MKIDNSLKTKVTIAEAEQEKFFFLKGTRMTVANIKKESKHVDTKIETVKKAC